MYPKPRLNDGEFSTTNLNWWVLPDFWLPSVACMALAGCQVSSGLPELARFGAILPHFPTDDHRKNEITNLISAFWKILEDVGTLSPWVGYQLCFFCVKKWGDKDARNSAFQYDDADDGDDDSWWCTHEDMMSSPCHAVGSFPRTDFVCSTRVHPLIAERFHSRFLHDNSQQAQAWFIMVCFG